MIEAKIVADSMSAAGTRLTTFVLTYPRFIHAEFMTHRVFSRNASSSRAIPTSKMIADILANPAMPLQFSKNCKGMQAKENIDELSQDLAEGEWLRARDEMISAVEILSKLGVHKQHANRLLEPFQHMNVVASATNLDNFFSLRCHKDAQPEFRVLAEKMYEVYCSNTPEMKEPGQWHLPFVGMEDFIANWQRLHQLHQDPKSVGDQTYIKDLVKISVARCARVSYNNHDGTNSTFEQDVALYDRLTAGTPMHASPTEHQAMSIQDPNIQSGNFKGWIQYRKSLVNENVSRFSES